MPCYIKGNKLFNNRVLRKNSIDKNVITSHINTSTTNRLIGKNPSTSMKVYSSQTDTYPDSVTASDIGDGILNGKPAIIPDYIC